jgi:hypothetical protein
MEEVFNVVYADAFSGDPSRECLDAYWALLKMYRDAIRLTTNRLLGTSHAGIGALIRFFFRRGETDFVFVTFNQDLLIEKALEAATATTRYRNLGWDIRHAYGVKFSARLSMVHGSRQFHTSASPPVSPIQVLKLHGSMNWVYRVRSAEDVRNALRTPNRKLKVVNDSVLYDQLTDRSTQRSVPVLPLIVPPVYEKSTHIRNVLKPVWAKATEALREADTLVVFGYSCPDADQAARNMIRRAFHQNNSVDHVHIIDPNPQAAGRIGSLLQAQVVTRYSTVADFCRHYGSA